MSVVFFTYAYPPAKYPRSIQISRLVKYSRHSIRVISCDDDSAADFTIAEPADGKPAELIRVPRRKLNCLDPRWWLNKFALPDGYRDWALTAAHEALARQYIGPRDTFVSFGDPMSDHLAGLTIKRATGAPWIAHFSDPWVDNPYRRRLPVSGWLNRQLEKAVIESADRVIFTSQETIDLVMRKYPASWRNKTHVLPHAFDPAMFGAANPRTSGVLVRYVGNFYRPRTPAALIKALLKLHRERPDIIAGLRVELIGHLHSNINLAAALSELPVGLMSVTPPVDYRTSLQMMQDADLLLVIDAPSDTSVFLPSKLVDYIGAGRPIFAITPPGASAELVAKLGGRVAHPEHIDDIATQLAAAVGEARTNPAMPWGTPVVRDEYSASSVAARFDALLDSASS
jgi:glycosyltransferase involved in cell wall biosynthesis